MRSGDTIDRLPALSAVDPTVLAATQSMVEQFGGLSNINVSQPFYFDSGGERQFAQVTPYRDPRGLDWLVVVVVPESDFMAQINANNRTTALLIGFSLLGSILLTSVLALWVTRPISRLNQSARALASGDLTQRLATGRRDEVGELTSSFNHMAEQLQTSFASLQASEERYRGLFEGVPVGMRCATTVPIAGVGPNQMQGIFAGSIRQTLRSPDS